MSSNFVVKRLCEHCGQVFEAKTTVTRFCSKLCNKRSYKQKLSPNQFKMIMLNRISIFDYQLGR